MFKVMTGNHAAAYGVMLCQPDVVCGYPITPQSSIPELISEFCAEGLMRAKFVNVDSEITALGYVIGASAGGVRVFVATSSEGLALMHEELHWAAGTRLPIVMVNVNRSVGPPLRVGADQTDSLSQRDTGWIQLYCESNQEIIDTVIQAYKLSESVSLPSMVCFDGFYLSHLNESTDIPDQKKVDEYLLPYRPTFKIPWGWDYGWKMYDRDPPEKGRYDRRNFMGSRYEFHKLERKSVDVATEVNAEFQALFGRSYPLIEEYKCDDADIVVVMSGSAVGTCRYVIDTLREKGHRIGLVKLKMFRPFPREGVRKALLGRKKIAIVERDLSVGQCGIFYQEIKWALTPMKESIPLYGFVSGLGGEDITPRLIEKAILFTMEKDPPDEEVIWLGLGEKGINDQYDQQAIKIY